MGGRRLDIGEHGEISYREALGRVTASFYYRNNQGLRRRIEATSGSRTGARREALASLEKLMSSSGVGQYSKRTTLREVAEQWHQEIVQLVAAGRRSPTTAAQYRRTLDRHVLPGLGGLRLSELNTARVDHLLRQTFSQNGPAAAKLCRAVLSGVCGFAVRRDAMRFNPVRDVSMAQADPEREARALTADECLRWLAIIDNDEHAQRKDLPDLVRFLLGTGCRIGEALAVRWEDVDLDRRLIHINRTLIRIPGQGLVTKAPKTKSGVRVLRISVWLVTLLRERRPRLDAVGPVFPSSVGGYRERNNVEGAFRRVRSDTEFEWVVPHTYRKTVATMLDQTGLSARTIADQLGHSRISMTQDVYMGRRAVDESAAAALEDIVRPAKPVDIDTPPMLFVIGK
jgi:integrase